MKDQPTAGQVTIGVQSSVGKGVLAGPLLSALMWVHFNFLFIFLCFFGRGSPLLNGGILKRRTTLDSTKVFASRSNCSQLYILFLHLQV